MNITDFSTIIYNFIFIASVFVGIGYYFGRHDRND